ncbi:MAG: ATP-binding protein [Gammaproteobacteria bacterium]|nr:ATP-binding protein [Gammaproteobacteria bacterium]
MATSHGQLFRTFNPGLAQSDVEIVDQFVVRHKELRIVVDTIKENMASDICQHILIIGQRGSGKTMLLARAAAELRKDSEFEGVIPVRFSEESDEVVHAASFWLEVLYQVAQEIGTSDPKLAKDTHATIADLSDRWRDSTAEEQAQSAALRLVQRLSAKVVLMVENLQSLFENTDESFGWKLREALQSSSNLTLVGTATLRFKGIDRLDMPFFEFFRVVNLAPLNLDSCKELWNKLTLNRFPSRQIRPLEILTGGNPRLLVVASNLALHDSLKQLMDELIRLIDLHTEYFRSRLEEIPTKERIVFLSMLDLWQDSTLKEIATRARMSRQSASGLLNRLTTRGAVVKLGSGRKHVYSVNERLFCFYYKLRYKNDGVAVVEQLVNFMVSFYSGAELKQLRKAISEEARGTPFIFDGLLKAKENFRFDTNNDLYEWSRGFDRDALNSIANLLWVNEILESSTGGARETSDDEESAAKTVREDRNQINQEEPASSQIVISIMQRVAELTKQGEYEKALNELSEIFRDLTIGSSGTDDDVLHAVVVYQMGQFSSILGRARDSAYSFDYFVDRFKESQRPVIRRFYLDTLKSQAWALASDNRLNEAIEKLDSALSYLNNLEQHGTLDQGKLLSHEDIFQIEVQRGIILRENDQPKESLQVFLGVLDNDRVKSIPQYRTVRESAQIELGIVFRISGQSERSILAFEDVINSVASNEPSPWSRNSIRAFREMAKTQLSDDPSKALKTIDAVTQKVDEICDEPTHVEFAQLLELKAKIEADHVNKEAALATRLQIYDRFHRSENVLLRSLACDSLYFLGTSAFRHQRWDELNILSKRFNRLAGSLPNIPPFIQNRFESLFIRTLTFVRWDDIKYAKALSTFREIVVIVEHGNPLMMRITIALTRILLSAGIKETELIRTLTGKKRDDTVLYPLVVALRMRIGDDIREPREIQKVAQDVYREIYAQTVLQ